MTKDKLRAVMVLGVLFTLLSCAPSSQTAVAGNERSPGADWSVHIEQQEAASNWRVTLEVTNLPPPTRLGPDNTVFVVWLVPSGSQPVRAGTLIYDEGSREGRFTATGAYSTFQVRVTAEQSAEVGAPSETVVFRSQHEAPTS